MVALQFRFSNPDVIPPSVRHLNRETQAEYAERKNRSSGVMIIEPTEKCSLAEFLGELEAAGYELVHTLYQERPHNSAKDTGGRYTYHMVRFLFTRCEFKEPSDEFKKVRNTIRAELRSICGSALWCVQIFLNPFYKNGEEIPGARAVSINLTARQPLFRPDGEPVTVWAKDEHDERVGDAPLPLKADRCLRIAGDAVQLVAA
ncbi:MAG: hypothetical protein HY435_03460 [Candidatus Liptonbacteria bacterium]|nr:hypothetical protein [Candidatus Liptonbacteria bacterium]